MNKPDLPTEHTDEIKTAEFGDAERPSKRNDRPRAVVLAFLGEEQRLLELQHGEEVTIGRSRTATISIPDPRVSRLHAKLSFDEQQGLWVEDLETTNGIELNRRRASARTLLQTGDEVRVVTATMVVGQITLAERPARASDRMRSFPAFEERLVAELDRASRYRRPLALLMVRLTGDASRDSNVKEALARQIRPMDALTQYGPRELAALFPELDQTQAIATARRFVETAAGAGGRLLVGAACFPRDGAGSEALIGRARQALKLARPEDGVGFPPSLSEEDRRGPILVSPAMRRVMELVEKVAPTQLSVLLLGETGVGKDVVAAEIHRLSPRAKSPLVRLNCAAIPENLLESELFGHEKGAFTGATQTRKGLFETAHGGTLFLDEIGEMSPATQSKLLRVLEARRILRVGGSEEIPVDVRILTATHRDLDSMVDRGEFRQDLLFRLNAFSIRVPPLRERTEDILPMSEVFLREASQSLSSPSLSISASAARLLCSYHWPGNVRELKNAMERAAVLADGPEVLPSHLPEKLLLPVETGHSAPVPPGFALQEEVAQVERETLVRALEACGGNRTHAAERLGISRRALLYKIDKYGLKDIGR